MPSNSPNRRVASFLSGPILLALALTCCKKPQPALPELTSASEVLERMVAAYHEASSYQDSAEVRLHFKKSGEKDNVVDEKWDYSIALSRPNKLRMHVYQSVVVCDGQQLHAALNLDEVRGQVLELPAPEKLTSQTIFESDPLLGQVLTQGGAAGPPVILPLLLEEAALDPVLEGADKPTLLPPEKADGEVCYRVEAKRPDGRLVFWIDQKNFVLRRIEYPTDEFKKGVEEKEGPVSELSLTVEFTGAKLNADIETAAFKFESPKDARLVQQFLVPPPLLGQKIGDFKFRGIEGDEITPASLAGKAAVIEFWATWCEPCMKNMPNVQAVADRYQGNDKIAFLAVSVDNDEVTDDAVREKFSENKLTLPIARDPSIAARNVFLVESLPTMVVLGADGVVQDYENVLDPNLTQSLPAKLDKLLAGESIFEEALRDFSPPPAGNQSETTVAAAEITPAGEPQNLKMSTVWACRDLSSPGNLLALTDTDGSGRLFVIDNWQTVVEFDVEGKPAAKHRLDLPKQPEEAVVSFLRTAVDGQGRRYFAGSANGVQQLFVFDADWKPMASFPTSGTHPGITDLQLVDLDADGELEIAVGFWGPAGVQCISLDGQRRWQTKSCENVLKLASLSGPADRQLLATTAQGSVQPIDKTGHEQKAWPAGKRFVQLVFAADLDGDGSDEICAIGPSKTGDAMRPGDNAVLGLDRDGEVIWQYDLPSGVPASGALEFVTSGNLVGDGNQWVVAGPDGSVHILSADGKLIDRFASGLSLTGLAVAKLDGQSLLVLASSEGVEARQLQGGE